MFAPRPLRCAFATLIACAVLIVGNRPAAAERPTAPKLLPKDTVAYVRIAHLPEAREKFQQTAMGRLASDDKIRPLISNLYSSAATAFKQLEEQVGASLDDVLAIPQGEFCVAVVVPPKGPLAVVAVVDVGDRLITAQKLLARGEQALAQQGATRSEELVGDTKLVIHELAREDKRRVVHAVRDAAVFLTSDVEVLKQMLATWNGEAAETLADNQNFTAIMKRCGGSEGERPQLSFFVDPIQLVKKSVRGSAAATGLALLPVLGLDGVQGVGGSVILATPEFDAISHLHLLLQNPRSGIPAMLALRSGDTTPESFVPADCASYVTLHWDFGATYDALTKLYNSFRGEDALARDIKKNISDQLQVDFQKELLDALDGRVTWTTWVVRPARWNSRSNLLALKLKDPQAFQGTMERALAKFERQMEKSVFGGVAYYHARNPINLARPPQPAGEQGRQNLPPLLRSPEPCVAVLGDYLVLTDSSECLHHAILAQSDSSQSLANQLDYKLITAKIRRQPGGDSPGLITFDRPEEGMRLMYEMATSDDVRQRLSARAENNQFFRALQNALKEHPLPAFSVIAQYLAPGGGLLTNDETGFHYTGFSLRRE